MRRGMAWVVTLRLGRGKFCCEGSLGVVDKFASVAGADGLKGKKHLKMPSACHFVA